MVRETGIYTIRNNVSGKIYVGSAVDVAGRWSTHRCELNGNKHGNRHLQRAWDKYGPDAFTFSVLIYCYPEDLIHHEQQAIDSYAGFSSLYNICMSAGSSLGTKASDETKRNMRIAKLGKIRGPHSEATKAKMRVSGKKRVMTPWTQERKDAQSKAHMGKSTSLKGKPWSKARQDAQDKRGAN